MVEIVTNKGARATLVHSDRRFMVYEEPGSGGRLWLMDTTGFCFLVIRGGITGTLV
jgi:hypothetical protein